MMEWAFTLGAMSELIQTHESFMPLVLPEARPPIHRLNGLNLRRASCATGRVLEALGSSCDNFRLLAVPIPYPRRQWDHEEMRKHCEMHITASHKSEQLNWRSRPQAQGEIQTLQGREKRGQIVWCKPTDGIDDRQ